MTAQHSTDWPPPAREQHPPDVELLDAQGEAPRHLLADAAADTVEAGVSHPAGVGPWVCMSSRWCGYPVWVLKCQEL